VLQSDIDRRTESKAVVLETSETICFKIQNRLRVNYSSLQRLFSLVYFRSRDEIRNRNQKIKKEQDTLAALTQLPDITIEEIEQIHEFLSSNYNKYIFI